MKPLAIVLSGMIVCAAQTAAYSIDPLGVPGPCWMVNGTGRLINLGSMCGDGETVTIPAAAVSPSSRTNASTPHRYPQAMVQSFMEGCMTNGGGGTQAYCNCALEKVQTEYTPEQFAVLSVNLQSSMQRGEYTPETGQLLEHVVSACATHLLNR